MSDAPDQQYTEVFLDWWSFTVFVGSMVIGFILGTAKQRWTLEGVQLKVVALEKRLAELEGLAGRGERAILVIENELGHIRSALGEIKNKLETL